MTAKPQIEALAGELRGWRTSGMGGQTTIQIDRWADRLDQIAAQMPDVDALILALGDVLAQSSDPNAVTGECNTACGRARRLLDTLRQGVIPDRRTPEEKADVSSRNARP